jgi:hypothetical protein
MEVDHLEMLYDERFRVSIPQRNRKPDITRLEISLDQYARPNDDDWFPGLEDVLLKAARQRVLQLRDVLTKNSEARFSLNILDPSH